MWQTLQTLRFLLLAGVVGLVGAVGAQSPAPTKTLRHAFPIAETGFDPAQITDLYSRTVAAGIGGARHRPEDAAGLRDQRGKLFAPFGLEEIDLKKALPCQACSGSLRGLA